MSIMYPKHHHHSF